MWTDHLGFQKRGAGALRCSVLAALAAGAAFPASAQDLSLRPGRWETSAKIELPTGADVPEGMPFAEPITMVQCVSPEEAAEFRSFDDFLPVEGCTLSRQDGDGGAMRLAATCVEDGERYEFDFLFTDLSPEHWAGEVKSRTSDPDLGELHMSFDMRRTGDACSPEELAAAAEYDDEE